MGVGGPVANEDYMQESITFTREQLYELVWQKPISRLAAEYSMSGAGFAKLCARHDIPTPSRGYWALLAVGRPPARPSLPAAKDVSPICLRVTKSAHAPQIQNELNASIGAERKTENRIRVAERLQAPCALVEKARTALQNAKPESLGLLERPPGCLDLRVSRAQLSRALRIADALLKSFEARGWDVAVLNDSTFVHIGEIPIRITIEEATETEQRPAKPDFASSYSFHYNHPETVTKLSGRLVIAIHEDGHLWNHSQQRNWRESEKRVLDDHLNDVVVGMLKLAAALKADLARRQQEACEEADRKRNLQAALDEQDRLRKALAREKAAISNLLSQAARWRQSQDIRQFVEHARERARLQELQLEGQGLEDWAQWALRQADRLDPFAASQPSILDDAERIEHMCDGLLGRR